MHNKILIISNEPLSESSANGRTMRNLLLNIPSENLAQFYLHGIPDREACGSFYCVSDRDALHAFLGKKEKRKSVRQEVTAPQARAVSSEEIRKAVPHTGAVNPQKTANISHPVRSYRNLVLRNVVWQSMRWWTKDFSRFLEGFAPDIVLLQAGDAPFMYNIARRIAKEYRAKLLMFNTEHYVLKKIMYAYSGENLFWHNILMGSLKRQYQKFMNAADYCIYNTEALEEAYQNRYPHPGKSSVLYTTSTLERLPDKSGTPFSLLYCGNLGAGRVTPIQEIAETLFETDPAAKLDIYGKFPGKLAQDVVCSLPNVCYHGFVDYAELLPSMSEATLLIHCEHGERLENLKYAFSTKIADSLASGRPFLVYASKEYPFVRYLLKNRSAHVAQSKQELKTILEKCRNDKAYLYQYTDSARLTAEQNHNRDVNCRKLEEILGRL